MKAGFTLLELLVVIAIVAILAGVGITGYQDSVSAAKRSTAIITLELIVASLKSTERLDPSIRNVSMTDRAGIQAALFNDQFQLQPLDVEFEIVASSGSLKFFASVSERRDVCRTESLDQC